MVRYCFLCIVTFAIQQMQGRSPVINFSQYYFVISMYAMVGSEHSNLCRNSKLQKAKLFQQNFGEWKENFSLPSRSDKCARGPLTFSNIPQEIVLKILNFLQRSHKDRWESVFLTKICKMPYIATTRYECNVKVPGGQKARLCFASEHVY